MKKILFELAQEYYWDSFEPIYKEFAKDKNYDLYIKVGKNHRRFLKIFLISQKKNIEKKLKKQAYKITNQTNGFDIVICGDILKNPFQYGKALLCNVDHAVSIKTQRYRSIQKQKDIPYIKFVEGQYRFDKFSKFTNLQVYITGMAKLDPLFNKEYDNEKIYKKYNLDKTKKTILYSPSYKPTSIFELSEEFSNLKDYNILIKLHPYSWNGKYASIQQLRYAKKIIAKNENLNLVSKEELNILPYLQIADTIITEGSSVMNEFLACSKCGIIYHKEAFHSDGESVLDEQVKNWLKDSFVHINFKEELREAVKEAVNPSEERKRNIQKDKDFLFSYTDGKAAKRIKEILENLVENKRT